MEFASRLRPVRLLICWVQMVYILRQEPQSGQKAPTIFGRSFCRLLTSNKLTTLPIPQKIVQCSPMGIPQC